MSIIWFNGTLTQSTISIDPADRGLTLGDGLFETILVHGTNAIWLNEHLIRMKNSAEELGIRFDESLLRSGVMEVLQKSYFSKSVLRITLSRGLVKPRSLAGSGLSSNLLISLSEFTSTSDNTIKLATSSIRRNESSPSSRIKTLSYIDNILAAREVSARADDGLLLNSAGNVSCTTIGNLFLLKGDQLFTPQADQGILPGIARGKLLVRAREVVVFYEDLFEADAVFRTNSLRLVTQVAKVDDRPLKLASLDEIQKFITERIAP